jgi:hypothetical protein
MLKPFPMLGLKFTTGAIPGKKLKRKADTDANESKQRYEGKRKDCHLNEKWNWSGGNKCFSGPNRFLPDLSVGLACLGISDVNEHK